MFGDIPRYFHQRFRRTCFGRWWKTPPDPTMIKHDKTMFSLDHVPSVPLDPIFLGPSSTQGPQRQRLRVASNGAGAKAQRTALGAGEQYGGQVLPELHPVFKLSSKVARMILSSDPSSKFQCCHGRCETTVAVWQDDTIAGGWSKRLRGNSPAEAVSTSSPVSGKKDINYTINT